MSERLVDGAQYLDCAVEGIFCIITKAFLCCNPLKFPYCFFVFVIRPETKAEKEGNHNANAIEKRLPRAASTNIPSPKHRPLVPDFGTDEVFLAIGANVFLDVDSEVGVDASVGTDGDGEVLGMGTCVAVGALDVDVDGGPDAVVVSDVGEQVM